MWTVTTYHHVYEAKRGPVMGEPRQELGAALWRLADLVRADERRRSFRAKAYRRAVWSLDDLSPDLSDQPDSMLATPGIGTGVLGLITEYRDTGSLSLLDRLEEAYPADVTTMRRLPRMTPTILRLLKGELGVETVDDLARAIDSGDVEALRGVGPGTAERWDSALALYPAQGNVPAYQAWVLADSLALHLHRHLGGQVDPAGSLRTMEEWVGPLELVATIEDIALAREFLETTAVARFLGYGDSGESILLAHEGVDVRAHLVPADLAGARLLTVTGPPAHVQAVLEAADTASGTEADLYAAANLPWVPPPARGLPTAMATEVVRQAQIRGDLHLHSDRSPDGRMGLEEILLTASDRGYEYVLITDHTVGLRFGGLDATGLHAQAVEIEETRSRFPALVVMHGAELNIGRDGALDIDDETLGILDMAVAGLHSYFDLDRAEQTSRIVRAMSHPVVKVLAHPTGRRIGTRPAVDLYIDAIIESAIEHDVALEVNGHRDRLDLSAPLIEKALDAGALLAANSDSHRIGEMGNIANSVGTMQRAGVGPQSVINCWPADRFLTWVTGSPSEVSGTGTTGS
jgi:DNA polymerase (family 10)